MWPTVYCTIKLGDMLLKLIVYDMIYRLGKYLFIISKEIFPNEFNYNGLSINCSLIKKLQSSYRLKSSTVINL